MNYDILIYSQGIKIASDTCPRVAQKCVKIFDAKRTLVSTNNKFAKISISYDFIFFKEPVLQFSAPKMGAPYFKQYMERQLFEKITEPFEH